MVGPGISYLRAALKGKLEVILEILTGFNKIDESISDVPAASVSFF